MTYYLVDLENIPNCLQRLKTSKDSKKVNLVIFYSDQLVHKIDAVRGIVEKYFKSVNYVHINGGLKNALDFNLVCYLGILLGSFRGTRIEIYVASNDSGYDSLRSLLNQVDSKFSISYFRVSDDDKRLFCVEQTIPHRQEKNPTGRNMKLSTVLVGDYSSKTKKVLIHRLRCKSAVKAFLSSNINNYIGSKQELHNLLVKEFGKAGKGYYTMVNSKKVSFKDIKCL